MRVDDPGHGVEVDVRLLPDDALGEKVCAVMVLGAGAGAPTLAEVKSFLTARGLAAFKLPDTVRISDALPVTAVGKIDKKALRAPHWEGRDRSIG